METEENIAYNEELLKELNFNEKWLNDDYKRSAEYREYLEVMLKELQKFYT